MARVDIDQNKKILTAHRLAGPHVRRTSNLIIQGARRLAPRGDHMSGSGKRQPGEQLRESLRIDSKATVNSITERIGSTKKYAASIHQGSMPHFIHGRGKMLRFEWERGSIKVVPRGRRGRVRGKRGRVRGKRGPGRIFYFRRVDHPGNKRPVRYLTTPMHLYGRMHGFRTSSKPVSRSRLP